MLPLRMLKYALTISPRSAMILTEHVEVKANSVHLVGIAFGHALHPPPSVASKWLRALSWSDKIA